MGTLKRFTKHPDETLDYDITFAEWLAARADTVQSFSASVDTGLTLDASEQSGGVIKLWVSGGLAGRTYKAWALLTTAGGRTKRGQVTVRVRS